MTNPKKTLIAALLDRSGSIASIREDISGAYDSFVADQRKVPGECLFTLAQFDTHYDEVYTDVPVAEVPPLNLVPRGMTALFDATGKLITSVGERLAALPEEERPGTVIVVIMTDGLENASREWTADSVKSLIEQQKEQYGWEFVYLGADQDAIKVASGMGIRGDSAMTYTRGQAGEALRMTSHNVGAYRNAVASGQVGSLAYSAAQRANAQDED